MIFNMQTPSIAYCPARRRYEVGIIINEKSTIDKIIIKWINYKCLRRHQEDLVSKSHKQYTKKMRTKKKKTRILHWDQISNEMTKKKTNNTMRVSILINFLSKWLFLVQTLLDRILLFLKETVTHFYLFKIIKIDYFYISKRRVRCTHIHTLTIYSVIMR
jgi:hypothetical protein